jgi:hypothetical protein
MITLDLFAALVVSGVFYGVLGLVFRRFKKRHKPLHDEQSDVTAVLTRVRHSHASATHEMTSRLKTLSGLQQKLHATAAAESSSSSSLHSIVGEVITLARQSQQDMLLVNASIGSELSSLQPYSELDPAGLAAEPWFPQGKGDAPPALQELRKSPRLPYPHIQLVAPASDESPPAAPDFFGVQFRDISTGGFSFYSPERLECDLLVARLGVEPDVVPVLAKIVHQAAVEAGDGSVVRVGCQIVRRV